MERVKIRPVEDDEIDNNIVRHIHTVTLNPAKLQNYFLTTQHIILCRSSVVDADRTASAGGSDRIVFRFKSMSKTTTLPNNSRHIERTLFPNHLSFYQSCCLVQFIWNPFYSFRKISGEIKFCPFCLKLDI